MEHSLSLVVPNTGEVVSLDDAAGCLRVLAEIRELEAKLKEAKAELTSALSAEFSRQGTKTLEIDGIRAELRGGSETVWDTEMLEQLRDLGLPEERMEALIKTEVSFKVDAAQAKRIAAANPQYAEVIESARKVIPKASYVLVTRNGGTWTRNQDRQSSTLNSPTSPKTEFSDADDSPQLSLGTEASTNRNMLS